MFCYRVIKVAKQFTDISFAVSSNEQFSHELEALGLSDKKPAAGIYDKKGKYAMSEEFSVSNLQKFVQDYVDGHLEPHIKSEPVPTPNDQPVKVDNKSNVLIITNLTALCVVEITIVFTLFS